MTAKNLFINSQRTGRTPCLPNAMRIRGPNIQFWRIWSKISPQIVFQVADSTKAGPLAVSDCHLVLPLQRFSGQSVQDKSVFSVTFNRVFCCIPSIHAGWLWYWVGLLLFMF